MPPLGILYIASYLEKHGIGVRVIDPFSEGKEEYVSDSPYVGITCMSNQWMKAKEIAKKIKSENPETIVVFGGVKASVTPEEVFSDENIDIVVVGEGEKTMLKIINENIKGGIVFGERFEDLDEQPCPARHLVNMKKYTARDTVVPFHWLKGSTIITSLGCPYSCIFCINSKKAMFGRRVRYHSPEYVRNEIIELVSTYDIEGLYFLDDNFLTWKKRAVEICKYIKPFELTWLCQSRVDTLNRKLLQALAESGCDGISFGVESGSPKVLGALDKRANVEKTIEAFDLCKEYDIKTLANVIIGSPEETMEDIKLTDKLLERIKPDYTEIWYLTPYEGTLLYDQALEKGWLQHNASFRTDDPQIEINFTLEELKEISKRFCRKHKPFFKSVKPYLNKYFMYDMMRLLWKKPSLMFKGVKTWETASRIYL